MPLSPRRRAKRSNAGVFSPRQKAAAAARKGVARSTNKLDKRGFYLVDADGNRLKAIKASSPSAAAKKALRSDFLFASAVRGMVDVRILDDGPRVFVYEGRLDEVNETVTFTDKKTGLPKTVTFDYKPYLRATGTQVMADPRLASGYKTAIRLSPYILSKSDKTGRISRRTVDKLAKADKEDVQNAVSVDAELIAGFVLEGSRVTDYRVKYNRRSNVIEVSTLGQLSRAQEQAIAKSAETFESLGHSVAGKRFGVHVLGKAGNASGVYGSYPREITGERTSTKGIKRGSPQRPLNRSRSARAAKAAAALGLN